MKMLTRRRIIAIAISVLVVAGATLAISAGVGQAGEDRHASWVGTWSTSLTEASLGNTSGSLTGFTNQSVRQLLHTSVSGDALRVRPGHAVASGGEARQLHGVHRHPHRVITGSRAAEIGSEPGESPQRE